MILSRLVRFATNGKILYSTDFIAKNIVWLKGISMFREMAKEL